MFMRQCGLPGAVVSAFALLVQFSGDQALAQDRRQECSTRYKAAKAEGTLGGLTWPQFFSRCMVELKAEPVAPADDKPAAAAAEPASPAAPAAAVTEPVAPETPAAATTEPPALEKPTAAEAPAAATPAAEAPVTPESPAVGAATTPPATPEAVVPSPPAAEAASPKEPAPTEPSAAEAAPVPREPVFPTAIAPAHAKQKASVARKKTCRDQYNANKANDANAGMKWTEKGGSGGYLGECLKRLKDAS